MTMSNGRIAFLDHDHTRQDVPHSAHLARRAVLCCAVPQLYGEDEPDMEELLEPEDAVTMAYWNNWQAQEAVLSVVEGL